MPTTINRAEDEYLCHYLVNSCDMHYDIFSLKTWLYRATSVHYSKVQQRWIIHLALQASLNCVQYDSLTLSFRTFFKSLKLSNSY